MNEDKLIELQMQLKQNQAEMMEFASELDTWGDTMKEKEVILKDSANVMGLPPVRNSLTKKRKKKKSNPLSDNQKSKTPKKIASYDYKAWDKFDVDKACEEVDGVVEKESSSDYETDEEAETLRKKELAIDHKEQGNSFFKAGKFDEAIEKYTHAIELDPENAILTGNRAMALLKQERYGAAELDSTTAISLDPTFVKAYARRGAARMAMKKYSQAEEDFKQVIKLDPSNKQARTELNTVHQLLNPIPELASSLDICDKGIIYPIYKSPSERSTKPLKRILIEEIGVDELKEAKEFREKQKSSEMNPVIKRDLSKFDEFVSGTCSVNSERNGSEVAIEEKCSSGVGDTGEKLQKSKHLSGCDEKSSTICCAKQDIEKDDRSAMAIGAVHHNTTIRIAEVTAKTLPLPHNSFQFQGDWILLRRKPDEFYQYLKQIDPGTYPRIFGEALDADMLSMIFTTLNKYYVMDKLDVYPVLHQLTNVKRFNTISMFLSNKDKQVLKEIFESFRCNDEYTGEQIETLMKAYDL